VQKFLTDRHLMHKLSHTAVLMIKMILKIFSDVLEI
jgi:hypothetical protein